MASKPSVVPSESLVSNAKRALRAAAGAAAALAVGIGVAGASEAKAATYARKLYRSPLVLTSFVQNGRTDIHRNEALIFKFSAILQAKSVDARSLRVLQLTGNGASQ